MTKANENRNVQQFTLNVFIAALNVRSKEEKSQYINKDVYFCRINQLHNLMLNIY